MRPSLSTLVLLGLAAACSTPLPKLTDTSDGPRAVDAADGDDSDGAVDTGFTGGSDGSGDDGDGSGDGDGGDSGGDEAGDSGGEGEGEGGDEGEVELEELVITSLSPDHGLTSGGETVRIVGGPFDSTATVRLGGSSAVVVSASESELVVTTPAASEGAARVTITTDTHTGTEPSLFTYYLDGRGYPGAVGVLQWFESVGSYWSSQSGGTGGVWFTVPDTSFSWWEQHVPALDTCRRDGSYTPSSSLYLDDPGLSAITLQPSSGSSITLSADSGGYLNNALTASQVAVGRSWTLAPLVGSGLPEEAVASFARMPAPPSVTSPTITGSGVDTVSPYFTLRWTPGGSDYVAIELYLDNGYGSADTGGFELVRCYASDDGSHQIDTSQFTSFPSGAQLNLLVSLVVDRPGGKLPWNQADARVAGMNGVLGAVFTN